MGNLALILRVSYADWDSSLLACTRTRRPDYLIFFPYGMYGLSMETNYTAGIPAATKRNILYRLLDQDLSQTALATKANIPTSTLHRKIHNPASFTLHELGNIAAALDIPFTELIKDAA